MDDRPIGVLSYIGMISFGQQAFFAISAYASGIATAMWGWGFRTGLPWGAAVAAAAAVLVGMPTLRIPRLYFSIATLTFAVAHGHLDANPARSRPRTDSADATARRPPPRPRRATSPFFSTRRETGTLDYWHRSGRRE